jgi:hypothetical protein
MSSGNRIIVPLAYKHDIRKVRDHGRGLLNTIVAEARQNQGGGGL